jgi:hypothetical protein
MSMSPSLMGSPRGAFCEKAGAAAIASAVPTESRTERRSVIATVISCANGGLILLGAFPACQALKASGTLGPLPEFAAATAFRARTHPAGMRQGLETPGRMRRCRLSD